MEEVPHLNIDELYEKKQQIDINRVNIYNKLLKRIHAKIKTASRQRYDNEFCSFVMPEFLVGFPNYNFEECLIYVMDGLNNDGFITKYVHPNLVLISWRHWIPQYVRDEIKKKTGKIIDKFGNEINDTKSNKNVSFKEDNKKNDNININKNYKPTGKFIYGNDILKTIKEII